MKKQIFCLLLVAVLALSACSGQTQTTETATGQSQTTETATGEMFQFADILSECRPFLAYAEEGPDDMLINSKMLVPLDSAEAFAPYESAFSEAEAAEIRSLAGAGGYLALLEIYTDDPTTELSLEALTREETQIVATVALLFHDPEAEEEAPILGSHIFFVLYLDAQTLQGLPVAFSVLS